MKKSRLIKRQEMMLVAALCFSALVSAGSMSFAAKPEAETETAASHESDFVGGERVARAPASQSRNVISRKRYPGGADEDDLQVQENLPIPSRTFDGTVGTTSTESTATETSEPAAHD